MSHTSPAKIAPTLRKLSAGPVVALTLALTLAGCGSDKVEEELLQRVAIAEAAAARADAARIRAEKAVENIGSSEFAEEGELTDEPEEPEEEESPNNAPEDQSIDNEIVAPPTAESAPNGRLPA